MLVLTRNEGQSVQLDNNILITVNEVSGGQVKIGISAPKEVNIVRSELLDDKKLIDVAYLLKPKR